MKRLPFRIFAASLAIVATLVTLWTSGFAQPITTNFLRLLGAASGSSPSLVATGGDTNIDITLTPKGTGTVVLGGSTNQNTFRAFFPATEFCSSDNSLMVKVRVAAGDWALARTASGAESYNISCVIPLIYRTTTGKGSRLDSFSISHQITTAALTSNTFTSLSTTTYANNTANSVSGYGGTVAITMPTSVQANPYLTAATLSAPAFMQSGATQVRIEWTAALQNTGVYRIYGIAASYTLAVQ